jgi:hypothetical protein
VGRELVLNSAELSLYNYSQLRCGFVDRKTRELSPQFHHTISEQLNSRLSESPRFFALLVVVSTGYGYVLLGDKLAEHIALFVLVSLLAYASVLWAIWYLAALGYAFRFLQSTQHRIETDLGWDKYTPRNSGDPPERIRKLSDAFWLLPGIYHAHAAGLSAFLLLICGAYWWYGRQVLPHSFAISVTAAACGLVLLFSSNLHYLRRFRQKRRSRFSAIFGLQAVWDSTFEEHERAFRSIEVLREMARELAATTDGSQKEMVQVLAALTKVCSEATFDVILLAGNKRGHGAMKIARGMFEISVTAAYLTKNPSEVGDYLSFAAVEAWNHLQSAKKHKAGSVSPELEAQAEIEYKRVRSQFSNDAGRVQRRWTKKSIRQMAEEIGRLNIYDVAYNLASELHHLPISGLIAHELDWTKEALFVARGSLLETVVALYNSSEEIDSSEFESRLNAAIKDFEGTRSG